MLRLYREISHQLYCRDAFHQIMENAIIQDKYKLIDSNGNEETNLRMTNLGVMYMYVPIPVKLKPEEYEKFLTNHLALLNDSFRELLLFNLIMLDSKIYKVNIQLNEANEEEFTSLMLIKFYRPFLPKFWIRPLIELAVTAIALYFLIKH